LDCDGSEASFDFSDVLAAIDRFDDYVAGVELVLCSAMCIIALALY